MKQCVKLYFKAINDLPEMFHKESIITQSKSTDINRGVN